MADVVPTTNIGTQRGLSWANLVLGILIFLVPFAAGITNGGFFANDVIVGVVVVILAAICVWAVNNSRTTLAWLAGINFLLGIWTIIAAYYYTHLTTNVMAANVILGIVLLILAGWSSVMAFRAAGEPTVTGTTGPRQRMGGA
jgi:hypothetical protein